MRAALVTSALTFVPRNYQGFVQPLLEDPRVIGLIECANKEWHYAAKGLALVASRAAPDLGRQLIRNFFEDTTSLRRRQCERLGKTFMSISTPNSREFLEFIENHRIDLVINARTRFIYHRKTLNAPQIGCINIHHGLLPDQRGLMCDFWSHLENQDSGFSIHVMTPKLDDGPILRAVPVPTDRSDYLNSIEVAAEMEARVCSELIGEIERTGKLAGTPNSSDKCVYRSNPGLFDFYRLRRKGVRI